MRKPVDAARIHAFMKALGNAATGPGRVYFTGGVTALLYGWRQQTIDIDIRLDPEPPNAFESLRAIKLDMDINVELASPQDFIPPLPGWQDGSIWVARYGQVDFFHYDLRAQALAKLERGHERDHADVSAMVASGVVSLEALRAAFDSIRLQLIRYPSIDARAFADKVARFIDRVGDGAG